VSIGNLDHFGIGIIVIYAVVKLLGNILINLLSGWSSPTTLIHIQRRGYAHGIHRLDYIKLMHLHLIR